MQLVEAATHYAKRCTVLFAASFLFITDSALQPFFNLVKMPILMEGTGRHTGHGRPLDSSIVYTAQVVSSSMQVNGSSRRIEGLLTSSRLADPLCIQCSNVDDLCK